MARHWLAVVVLLIAISRIHSLDGGPQSSGAFVGVPSTLPCGLSCYLITLFFAFILIGKVPYFYTRLLRFTECRQGFNVVL